ncbi:hypothetical protein HAZT_HAZT006161 [Hyalella azteca]|uniref:Uncharacterized protein n=1 Tax=Hyalella azteca TaxID=294128 RepID=A0A6A0H333_HYAAZ|nr:hypothetical protein HAZT_HAZT006161 [Hyalella azteca]
MDLPYYARRLHLGAGGRTSAVSARQDPALLQKAVALNTGSLERGSAMGAGVRRLRSSLLEEARTAGAAGAPHPSPNKGLPALSLLDINPAVLSCQEYSLQMFMFLFNFVFAEFLKYKVGVGSIGGVTEGVSGILWVHLLAGRGLKAAGRAEFRDLYCVLECDRVHKARTVVRTGDHNFDWDETFDLDLINNKELDFLIYSWDPQFRHKLCYKGSVHLVSLLKEAPLHQLALKVEPRGTLYLKLSYTPPVTAFIRSPKLRKSAVFGVDLDTVSQRESGGSAVPLVIARCVAEVERRGLDIIGLYRLCGSATKKRLLRDAFERNPRLVDLSADNVPDINVITGILKDYLRELPEPLFTKCLYQMLVDALTITLFLLMDHLRLVSSQSERNKMTTQNLAICFGPVLMLQSEPETIMDFHQPISILKFLLDLWPSKSDSSGSGSSECSECWLAPQAATPASPPQQPAPAPPHDRCLPNIIPRGVAPNTGGGSGSSTPLSPQGSESDSSPNPPVSIRAKLPSQQQHQQPPRSSPGTSQFNAINDGSKNVVSGRQNGGGALSGGGGVAESGGRPGFGRVNFGGNSDGTGGTCDKNSSGGGGIVGGVPLPGMVSQALGHRTSSVTPSGPDSSGGNTSGSITSTPTSSITSPPSTMSANLPGESFSQSGGSFDTDSFLRGTYSRVNMAADHFLGDGSAAGGYNRDGPSLPNEGGATAVPESSTAAVTENLVAIPPNSSMSSASGGPFAAPVSSSGGPFGSLGLHQVTNISTNPFLNGRHLLTGDEDEDSLR